MAADSGMDTCPSPEIADSRKRPLDGDNENGDTKRSHFSTGNVPATTYDILPYIVLYSSSGATMTFDGISSRIIAYCAYRYVVSAF